MPMVRIAPSKTYDKRPEGSHQGVKKGPRKESIKQDGDGEKAHAQFFKTMDVEIDDKAIRKVLAPFIPIVRKKYLAPPPDLEVEAKQFQAYLERKPEVLVKDLSSFMSDRVDLKTAVHQTAEVLKICTNASAATVYMIDSSTHEIFLSLPSDDVPNERYKLRWQIKEKSTVAAHVAQNKEIIILDDILEDQRFPEGVAYQNEEIKAVLCAPVTSPDGVCFAVLELVKTLYDEPFQYEDVDVVVAALGWMGVAIFQNQKRLALQRQQELSDYLIDLTKCYFEEKVGIDKMVTEVLKFAKQTLGAEHGSFFILRGRVDSEELIADMYDDEDTSDRYIYRKTPKVRLTRDKTIAGLVAQTGLTVNLKNAYSDARFNEGVDNKTGIITRAILCMPIRGNEGIIGAVQVMNKKNGSCFTTTDETLFKTFSSFCALSLHYAKIAKKQEDLNTLNSCYKKMLKDSWSLCRHDKLRCTFEIPTFAIPANFDNFSFFTLGHTHDDLTLPRMCVYMFRSVLTLREIQLSSLLQFFVTVRKMYRDHPYHNFEHAFNTLHCMYVILRSNADRFTRLEVKALMVAAICHDVDHPGVTDHFLVETEDDLHFLYKDNPIEHQNFGATVMLLEEHHIFRTLRKGSPKWEEFKTELRNAILSTNLSFFFRQHLHLVTTGASKVNWDNCEDREAIKGVLMQACDLSMQCQPYPTSDKVAKLVYAEFHNQGDREKVMGLSSLPIMDRNRDIDIVIKQIEFFNIVVVPCMVLLECLLPNTQKLHKQAIFVRKTWKELVDLKDTKCWRQENSLATQEDTICIF